jgi:hypothetical protein
MERREVRRKERFVLPLKRMPHAPGQCRVFFCCLLDTPLNDDDGMAGWWRFLFLLFAGS